MATTTVEPKPSVVQKYNLRWLLRLLTSSIGRKVVMGLTGLLLCGFLVVHLAGNLLIYSGRAAYDGYAHKLHEQEWLPLAEAALFALFAAHIYLAVVTTRENRRARAVGYAVKESKIPGKILPVPTSNWMFLSGAVVLGFLCLHIVDMKLQARSHIHYEGLSPFQIAVAVLSDPLSQAVYIAGTIFLGFHLSHGFASAFQSLGLRHPKYTPVIKAFGLVFAVVIAAGFCSLPILVRMMPGVVAEAKLDAPPVSAPVHPN